MADEWYVWAVVVVVNFKEGSSKKKVQNLRTAGYLLFYSMPWKIDGQLGICKIDNWYSVWRPVLMSTLGPE